jgi:hypothetical protein
LGEINIILNILETLKNAQPNVMFINSLHEQFCNRGGLSKKQLEGLYSKAEKTGLISPAKLATLEAIIKKKPTRYKSDIITKAPEPEKKENILPLIDQILGRYPQHKMAIFLQSKIKHNDSINDQEIAEIKRLAKLLLK